jgi:hypothetical protein
MSVHDDLRARHRAQDNPIRGSFSTSKLPRLETEPQRPEQLPWPENLFGELASIAELMAEARRGD